MRDKLDKLLRDALQSLEASSGSSGIGALDPELQRTRDPRHGDFTSNVALRAAKVAGASPRDLAAALVERIGRAELVAKIDVAGPGFINFTLTQSAYRDEIKAVAAEGASYGTEPARSRSRVLVEYVSANPTGPLHVGHGRHAGYGATLANILRARGHAVDEEYYVNDAGRQMNILAASVWLRYLERHGAEIAFPPNCYQGEYVREIAFELDRAHGNALVGDPRVVAAALTGVGDGEERLDAIIDAMQRSLGPTNFAVVFSAALQSVLADIKDDLEEFSVTPDRWFSEQSLIDSGAVGEALELLRGRDMLYVQDGATWFRSTRFGDDKDRVVVRENGQRTYFASDIAYHLDKCKRGYDLFLNVLGADHHGYVPRIRAVLAAFGEPASRLEVELVQFVVLYRGKVKAQMSTRSGEYVTLRELRDEVGNDAARFFYVSRSNDQHLEFDLELAKSQSSDNPVYYVQYAHARVASMLARMREHGFALPDTARVDLTALELPEEQSLMRVLSRYAEVVDLAAANRAPQHVVHYLRELAGEFHSYYNAHKILVDASDVRDARVTLALATQQVIANGLKLLDVSAPTSM